MNRNQIHWTFFIIVVTAVGAIILVYTKAIGDDLAIAGAILPAGTESEAILRTNFGDITMELYESEAPLTVRNFRTLANDGFYDNTKFHRVIRCFMIQGGDPKSKDDDWSDDGTGGPGYTFADEINRHKMLRGAVAMANAGPDTNGSQFFIVTAEAAPWLDGKHTVFGRVVSGMDAVLAIERVPTGANDHPTLDVIIDAVDIVR